VEWLLENYCLVELTLVSDTFFLTQDLKRIHESHDGIIYIIPIVTKDGNAEQQTQK
jgi:exonuclease SbcD